MTPKEKHEHLLELTEDRLRREVLVPLLSKLGFIDPILHHHAGEKGKDIVCKELDSKFGKTRYLAVVVKRGDVTGSASGSNSYFTVINQIKQAINEPFKHVYELREVFIDQVVLIISGRFLPTALESVYGTLRSEKLDKAIRDAIDIEKLTSLIDASFPEYWDEVGDEKTSLVRQRNTLLNNLGKLLAVLVPDAGERDNMLRRMAADELDVQLFGFSNYAQYMIDLGYRTINVEEIDPQFTASHLNTDYQDIKESMFRLKQEAQKALMHADEQIDPLRRILAETNPKKLLEHCEDLQYFTNYRGEMPLNVGDIVRDEDLQEGIRQYEERQELLTRTQQTDLYAALMRDMHEKIHEGLAQFWGKHPRDDRKWWLGYKVRVSLADRHLDSSDVYEFEQTPRVLRDDPRFPERETSRVFVDTEGVIHVENAVNYFGIPHEEKLSIEGKAEEFLWYYEHSLASIFFKMLENSLSPDAGRDDEAEQ